MIPAHEVITAVVTQLRTAWADTEGGHRVGDGRAPTDTTSPYAIVETPAGPGPVATIGDPRAIGQVRVRIRSVATVGTPEQQAPRNSAPIRQQAQMLDQLLGDALMDTTSPIEGDEWRVTGRILEADGGVQVEGAVANAVSDYVLTVSAKLAPVEP